MKPLFRPIAAPRGRIVALLAVAVSCHLPAAPNVESQDAGPVNSDAKYYISPGAIHVAVVAPKGSRKNVVVDGVAGPRVDDVIEPQTAYIDLEAYQELGLRANTSPGNLRPTAPVTFSADGKRYSYVARVGSEAILIVDGQEMLRFPSAKPTSPTYPISGEDVRVDFTGQAGRHALLALRIEGGWSLYVDGQKWPGVFTDEVFVSPDGDRIVYPALIARDKNSVILDAKDVGDIGTNFHFTPDSKHLVSMLRGAKGCALLMDGKPVLSARELVSYTLAPVGFHFGAVVTHFDQQGGRAGQVLVVDGKPVPASLSQEITGVSFSPDGKHFAAICGGPGRHFAVVDGKKGQEYADIGIETPGLSDGPRFSPDSSKFSYTARVGSKSFAVVNEDESDGFYASPRTIFSPDGRHVVILGLIEPGAFVLIVDGKSQKMPGNQGASRFAYSPDMSHYTYSVRDEVFIDSKTTGIGGEMAFSPDGKHYAIVGHNDSFNGLFLDGTPVFNGQVGWRAFTPDGQHLYWTVRGPSTKPNAEPGSTELTVYLDGKVVTRFDDFTSSRIMNLRLLYGQMATPTWDMPKGWHISPEGVLTVVGPDGDAIKRFSITPAPDTNLTTMLEEAKAADAKGKAKGLQKPGKQASDDHPQNAPGTTVAMNSAPAPHAAMPTAPNLKPPASSATPGPKQAPAGAPAFHPQVAAASPQKSAASDDSLAAAADAVTAKAKAEADAAAAKAKAFVDNLLKKK